MKLIVGLGNPGEEYTRTRHNVGFLAVDRLAHAHGIAMTRRAVTGRQRLADYGDGQLGRVTARLLKPQTMMNASGDALRDRAAWGVDVHQVLIVCDDVNLPLGTLRLRPQGSAGGHHGLASCLEALGTEHVSRLRLGVGTQPLPRDLTEYVLGRFRPDEERLLDEMLQRALETCEEWAMHGLDAAMNRMNGPGPQCDDQ